MKLTNLNQFHLYMSENGYYTNLPRLKYFLNYLFSEISFENKNVLDIGGGTGLLSFYAAANGAKKVICLEPETAGSSKGLIENFEKTKSELKLSNVHLLSNTLQEYDPTNDKFDIIISHNSINHLNEPACVSLLTNENSRKIYHALFQKLNLMSASGAKVIICDCSRHNFFKSAKLKNPFVPTIEWNKHQSPQTWANLLKEAGFSKQSITWTSFNSLGGAGRFLFGNKIAAFFLMSHFKLNLEKVS